MKNPTVKARMAGTFSGLVLIVILVAGVAIDMLLEANARFESYVDGINARAMITARV